MPFLLRVLLPDVPGSLGRVATAIGMAGGDIEAIEIVEKRDDGTAVDDVLLELQQGMMPDSVVSACTSIEGVEVLWISRYPAGGSLVMDLEAVEELTASPETAYDKLIDLLPATFRVDWGARVHRAKGVVYGTGAAPDDFEFIEIETPQRLESPEDEVTLFAAARLDGNEIVVVGRRGGPEFADSEIARLGHLCGLTVTIANA
ncbi:MULTISPECIES: ACT domain-containing protein [unclassified Nocardioides]|uniref:ACT domain-containing protein n=1 Tax=unclassified Nocardioides TaxID=2615069 RepID=UPI0006F64B7A|nr:MULTISPECIES: ACT domain-containing protein [unclassified Nocardioides]KRA38859.1 amino acid-binding protein [Nocardioides sp. Root614]KRA92819.1 amino acid-binding protein [Nocardioides sp. Root682]